jgi:hypothetical protein
MQQAGGDWAGGAVGGGGRMTGLGQMEPSGSARLGRAVRVMLGL